MSWGVYELRAIDPDEALVALSGHGSWRQYPTYSQLAAERVGASSNFFAIYRAGLPAAVFNLRSKELPFRLGTSALISHGPVLLGPKNQHAQDLKATLQLLSDLAEKSGTEVRIDPDPNWAGDEDLLRQFSQIESEVGGVPYRTIRLDLSAGIEAIQANLHPKWKASFRKSQKYSLETYRSNKPDDILKIRPILEKLMERKKFGIDQTPEFFAAVANLSDPAEPIMAHWVIENEDILSVHIGAYSGETGTYLLGATTSRGYQVGAAYAAQICAIETAIEIGQKFYDTGGIDPDDNAGVYRFKKRMGGQEVLTRPIGVIRPNGIRKYVISGARMAYRMIKN